MTAYLDASVLFAMVVIDHHSPGVKAWLDRRPELAFSLWTVAETSSALSHAQRTGRITPEERQEAEIEVDRLLNPQRPSTSVTAEDFGEARRLLYRHGNLRAPDALHLAVARRENWSLATLDVQLAKAAQAEGVPLALG